MYQSKENIIILLPSDKCKFETARVLHPIITTHRPKSIELVDNSLTGGS